MQQPNRRYASGIEDNKTAFNDTAPLKAPTTDRAPITYPLDQSLIRNAMVFYFNTLEDYVSIAAANPKFSNTNYIVTSGVALAAGAYEANKNSAYQQITQDQKVNAGTANLSLFKKYKRTDLLMWLMMPQSVQFATSAGWEAINANMNALGLLAHEAGAAAGAGDDSKMMANLISAFGTEAGQAAFDAMGGGSQDVGSAVTNSVQNTFNEMAFKGMQRRQFQFSWQVSPKSLAELEELDKVIQHFRFHAHPGLSLSTTSGSYLDFPGTVDVEWYTKGEEEGDDWIENAWLPRISTCVIASVETDYSPNNQYSFFKNAGAPTQINLTVTLQEIQPLLKSDISRGF